MNFLYILLALFIFGLLIFIHELGHFLVARMCGVKILEFAIGMGPKLISWKSKKSGTAYSLRLLPLGGFVSMLGENGMEAVQGSSQDPLDEKNEGENFFLRTEDEENDESEKDEADEALPQMSEEEAKHAYCNQSVWKRMLISIAGPAMNVILGFLFMLVMVVASGSGAVGTTDVAGFYVVYSAQESYQGIEQNDYLYTVDGVRVLSYAHLQQIVSKKDGGTFEIRVLRADANEPVLLENVTLSSASLSGMFDYSLSEKSGLMTGDRITKVNGTSVHTYHELAYEIMNQGYQPLKLTVIRNGEKTVLPQVIVPSYVESGVTFGDLDFLVYPEANFGVGTVLKHTWFRSLSTVKMVFDSLGGLFSGRYGVEAVSGPVGITKTISDAAKMGFLNVLYLVVVISINLGIMNLLPFPALDGGHLLIYVIEAIRRKPMKKEVEGVINFIGLIVLLSLAVIISIKDFIAL